MVLMTLAISVAGGLQTYIEGVMGLGYMTDQGAGDLFAQALQVRNSWTTRGPRPAQGLIHITFEENSS